MYSSNISYVVAVETSCRFGLFSRFALFAFRDKLPCSYCFPTTSIVSQNHFKLLIISYSTLGGPILTCHKGIFFKFCCFHGNT